MPTSDIHRHDIPTPPAPQINHNATPHSGWTRAGRPRVSGSRWRTRRSTPDIDQAWELYEEVFAEVNDLAAQRHLMTYDEFQAVYHDGDVRKFYAHDEAGRLIGMATLTNNLAAWPLIAPQYFARRWPHFFSRRAIWYCGFVGARPNQLHAFRDLVTDMYHLIRSNDGMTAMDFCTHNIITRRLPDATLKLLGRLDPTTSMEVADQQTFIVYHFGNAGAAQP